MEIIEPMQNEAVESEMSNNPMHTKPTRLRGALPDQSGLGSCAVRLQCEGGECAECTVRAAARLKANGMAISGTAPGRRK